MIKHHAPTVLGKIRAWIETDLLAFFLVFGSCVSESVYFGGGALVVQWL